MGQRLTSMMKTTIMSVKPFHLVHKAIRLLRPI
jgi:hypothetical protein